MLVGIQDEILRLHSMGLLVQLLADKTTKTNIVWGTDAYVAQGREYQRNKEIHPSLITGQHSDTIKLRTGKAMENQSGRTRKHAEVFTPLWLCQKMVSHIDAVWFEKADPFLRGEQSADRVLFPRKRKWQHYIDARRLEITCGEGPYLVNRYDVSTGEGIALKNRSGILDRKLRVVNENTVDEAEWLKWALRAFQSTYGYEFQGDNLLIARVNLLMTYEEYLQARWKRKPTTEEYRKIEKTIAWNIWQMDGLNGTIPCCKAPEEFHQTSMFERFENGKYPQKTNKQRHCRIFDWRRGNSLEYLNVNSKGGKNMKFDFIIGNPPYQDESNGELRNFAPPIYNLFLDSAYAIADTVELVHPARFLFDAGSTPKDWNRKMLQDEHLKVIFYEQESSKVFANTDIKGGIVITYRNAKEKYGAIETFTTYPEINSVLKKVRHRVDFESLTSMVYSRTVYRLTDTMHQNNPDALSKLSTGHAYDMSSNIFQRLQEIFYDEKPEDGREYIKILGRDGNQRVYKYIRRDYVNDVENLNAYKVYVAQANGSGAFGETLSSLVVEGQGVGATETFISIGKFDTRDKAYALEKYIKTKFARALLSVLKVTQNGNKPVWRMIPLQNFTSASDIDWSKSIAEIDRQLYAKYGLDEKEIAFVETHVKEMA